MSKKDHIERAQELTQLAARHADVGAGEFLDRGVLTPQQIADVAGLIQDALFGFFADTPNEKRIRRKIRDACMLYFELDMERNVDDQLQAQAVKLLREKVIRRAEKERLANELADMALERWGTLDEDTLDELVDEDDGLLPAIKARTASGVDPEDKELVNAIIETCRVLAAPFIQALAPEDLDTLISGSAEVCDLIAGGKSVAEAMRRTATHALEKTGIIKAMRRSFAGLLLGDLLLNQVGKSLGVKEKISVTDFIIFLGCQIADKQLIPEVDKADAASVRDELKAI